MPIEYLHKIPDQNKYNYDLVILDEIESLLYHFTSPTIENKQYTFELMCDIIKNSKNILALDHTFIIELTNLLMNLINQKTYRKEHTQKTYQRTVSKDESKNGFPKKDNIRIIHNKIKKDRKKFIFVKNYKKFDNSIDENLKNGKKIVIVSMTSGMALKYYEKYKSKYKTILHYSKSNDADKELLKNVEANWLDYDLVIYSPSIQSGVSFNIEHFDKLYIILSSNSCSPRDLMQMTNRVRQFKNNEVEVYLNKLPFREKANTHTYDKYTTSQRY